jgi:purine-cytosine permease-like protein
MYLVINKCVTAVKVSDFSRYYLRNRSTLNIGVLGYIGIFFIAARLSFFVLEIKLAANKVTHCTVKRNCGLCIPIFTLLKFLLESDK